MKRYIITSVLLINCIYSVDSHIIKNNYDKLNVIRIETKASSDCTDSESRIFNYRKNALDSVVENKLIKEIHNNTNHDSISIESFEFVWMHCTSLGNEFSEEERKESNQTVLIGTLGMGTLLLFPVPIKARYYLKIKSKINSHVCESYQPIRYGFILHILQLPLFVFNFTNMVNNEIVSPAIDRGIDDIIDKYQKGLCKKDSILE